jgi:hypothetical protein
MRATWSPLLCLACALALGASCAPDPVCADGEPGCDDAGDPVSPVVDAGGPADTTPPTVDASPPGGPYATPPEVTLTASEPSTVYYTLDGTVPTTASASGDSPVTFAVPAAGGELRFFAVDEAGNEGSPRSELYIVDSLAPTTTATPPAGAYQGVDVVVLEADEAATIYYTTDGTDPTTSSASGPSPVTIADIVDGRVIRFFAVDHLGNSETIKEASYVVDPLAPVTRASPPGGQFQSLDQITLTSNEPATIYYTTDGSEPTLDSPSAADVVLLDSLAAVFTVRFFAVDALGNREGVLSESYVIDGDAPQVRAQPAGGRFSRPPIVLLTSDEPATIYYTTDGSPPDPSSPSAIDPVVLNEISDGMVVRYFGVDPLGNVSAEQSDTYILDPGVPTTTALPPGGTYATEPDVVVSADEPATIYYTTDGSTPTLLAAQQSASPLTLNGVTDGTVLRFFSVDLAGNQEGVRTEAYVVDKTPAAVTATPTGGLSRGVPLVVLTSEPDATIHWTTDGTDPTTSSSSALGTAFVTGIANGTELRFLSVDTVGNTSAISSESYEIDPVSPITNAAPPGGTYDAPPTVTLTSNEPATIHYTLDGSTPTLTSGLSGASPVTIADVADGTTIRWFATDPAGNVEAVTAASYAVDAVAPMVSATPAGGVYRELPVVTTLLTDPGTTVYFTIDGSEPSTASTSGVDGAVVEVVDGLVLKYFAVDAVGNASAVQTDVYDEDQEPPPPVEGLSLALAGGNANLSWTNPTVPDLTGVLVVKRAAAPPMFAPTPGSLYTAPQDVGISSQVVQVAPVEQASETAPVAGFDYYDVYAFDAVGNYSEVRRVSARGPISPLPSQNIVLDVSMDGSVSVAQAPADFGLTAYAQYDATSDVLTTTIELTNLFSRLVFNTRVEEVALPGGAVFDDSSPAAVIVGGKGSLLYGVPGFDVGETRSRDLVLSSVDGSTDPVRIELTVAEAPVLFSAHQSGTQALDSAGTGNSDVIGFDAALRQRANKPFNYADGVVTPDGRTLLASHRRRDRVSRIDLVTLVPSVGRNIGSPDTVDDLSSVRAIELSPDGTVLYALYTRDGHRSGWRGGDTSLYKLDALTLNELGKLPLHDFARRVVGQDLAISPDGAVVAVGLEDAEGGGFLPVVDTTTLTLIDTDPSTPLVADPIDVSPWGGGIKTLTFTADGSQLVAARPRRGDGALLIVERSDWSIRLGNSPGLGSTATRRLRTGPDGRIYAVHRGDNPGVRTYDAGADSWNTIVGGVSPYSIFFSLDGTRMTIVAEAANAGVYDITNDTLIGAFPVPGGWVWGGSYIMASTPF